MFGKRYGTPIAPGMRRSLRDILPKRPKSREETIGILRRPRTWIIGSFMGGLLVAVGGVIISLVSPPPLPALDGGTTRVILTGVSFDRPSDWIAAISDPTLDQPAFFYAPQNDVTAAPITLSLYAADTARPAEGGRAEALRELAARWVEELIGRVPAIGRAQGSEFAHGTIDRTGVQPTGIRLAWDGALIWRPLLPTPPPNETPPPSETAAPTPTPDPGLPAPSINPEIYYPVLGPAVDAVGLTLVQAFYLPDSIDFGALSSTRQRALVITLSIPSNASSDRRDQALRAFESLITSVNFGS
jgi:hypothetical protein